MGKKRMLALAVLGMVILGAAIWLAVLTREQEPTCQGHPLNYWLNGLTSSDPNDAFPDKPECEVAIREMGTNCVPTLVRMMRERRSIFGFLVKYFGFELHLTKHDPTSMSEHNYQAAQGFRVLGIQASNAVPSLLEIFQEKADGRPARLRQYYAINALGFIGKGAAPAVPILLREIANSNSVAHEDAIIALGHIHAEPERVVPVLISLLKNPDTNIKSKAIRAIGNFGADAKPALPHLYELLEDQESCDSDVREALLKIDPEAPAKLQKYPPPAD